MKNYFWILFLIVSLFSEAQNKSKPSFFGIKVGANVSSITGDFSENFNSRFSFHIGMAGEIEINKKLRLAPELLFSSVGAENNILNYISLPIDLRYYPTSIFYIEAGPQAAFSVGAVKSVGSTSLGNEITNINRTDFGFNLGLGFKIDSSVLFGFRYYKGVSNLNKDEEFVTYKNKNSVFQFSLTYLFEN